MHHHLMFELSVVVSLMYVKITSFKAEMVKRKTFYFYYCFVYITNITIFINSNLKNTSSAFLPKHP